MTPPTPPPQLPDMGNLMTLLPGMLAQAAPALDKIGRVADDVGRIARALEMMAQLQAAHSVAVGEAHREVRPDGQRLVIH